MPVVAYTLVVTSYFIDGDTETDVRDSSLVDDCLL
jgi:hypothetical protein